jgi:exopolyphosphatase/guanosine-5'-triphosphate,3'-diphosphate pyrophosphatase
MFAAIDLGSNSFRLHIARYDGAAMQIIKSARDPVRLGAGLDSKGNLSAAAIEKAIAALARFNAILSSYPLSAVRVVATNTVRVARNAAQFLAAAEAALGYPIEIISGEEEGRLIYMGVASVLNSGERRLVIDIGGGSTELIIGKGQQIERVESFTIGTVPQNLAFFPGGRIEAAAFDEAILSARSRFEDAALLFKPEFWSAAYGSSGTVRAIADAIAKNELGDGEISLKSLQALKKRLIAFGHADDIALNGMKPDRATVIAGGTAVLIAMMQEIGIKTIIPVDAGLRMGVLWDLQWRASKLDRRDQSVRDFLQRFAVDAVRAEQVAQTAVDILALLKPADDAYIGLLGWSGLLHEIGLVISHSGHHKHAAYMIENADLPGFTAREQRVMSRLVLAQKGNLRKVDEMLSNPDFAKAVLALRLAAMFMHARIDLQADDWHLKMKSRIEIELRTDWLRQHATVSYWMEKEKEVWDEVGVEFSIRQQSS